MPTQENPYQNGQGPDGVTNSRKEAWDAQYRQNHWSNQPENRNGQSGMGMNPQGNPYQNGQLTNPQGNPGTQPRENQMQRGAFSGILQEAVEKSEEIVFEPYEKVEMPESRPEHNNISEPIMADSGEDAKIVLEAAEEVVKMEERSGESSETALDSEKIEGSMEEESLEKEKNSSDIVVEKTDE